MEAIRYGNENNYSVLCLLAGNSKMRPKYIDKILHQFLTMITILCKEADT